ncbi:MAG: type IIL restriction-modification enzyme MmeI, partial [Brevinema sp.]
MKLHNETEIRTKLNTFIPEHEDFNYEKGQSQVFWSDFFQCFGVPANIYGLWFENAIGRKFIDAFYPKHFIIEQKSEGRDLDEAYTQALDYANRLEVEKRPRFIVVCDFKEFRVKDLSTLRNYEFHYSQIEDYINLWREILGEKKDFFEEITVNIEAGNIMADLHDALKASGYEGRDLEILLV